MVKMIKKGLKFQEILFPPVTKYFKFTMTIIIKNAFVLDSIKVSQKTKSCVVYNKKASDLSEV
jgi:hypothetical protein